VVPRPLTWSLRDFGGRVSAAGLHELDAFSQMLAVTETVAHLDLLAYARPRNDRT
jgi:hypothetical protein